MVYCIFGHTFVFNMILRFITEANKKIIYKTANALNTRLGIHAFILRKKTKKICFPDCDVKKGKWYPEKQTVTTMIQTDIMTKNSFSLRFPLPHSSLPEHEQTHEFLPKPCPSSFKYSSNVPKYFPNDNKKIQA